MRISTQPFLCLLFICLFFPSSLSAQLLINEFMASNENTITDENGEYEDWIEIYNAGTSPIDIGGYFISDDISEPTTWQIPTTDPTLTTILPGGFLLLWADKDTEQGILHVDIKLGTGGEDLVLTQADGLTTEDQLTFGEQSDDVSYGRSSNGGTDFQFFPIASPGASNEMVSLPTTYQVQFSVPVSHTFDDALQFGVSNGSMYIDGFGMDMVDSWSNQKIGLRFRDLAIPSGATILSAYLQFTAKDETEGVGNCELEIRGEDSDDAAIFTNSSMNISNRPNTNATVDWEPVEWHIFDMASDKQKTPDLKNIVQEIVDRSGWELGNNMVFKITGSGLRSIHNFESGFPVVLSIEMELPIPTTSLSNIYINEIAPNGTSHTDETEDYEDWLELYNDNNFPVSVGGMFLSDDYNDLLQWQISEAAMIPAKGYLTIWADEETYKGGLHANFKLSADGESLALSQVVNNEIVVIDSLSYQPVPFKASTGRETDGDNDWVIFGEITPDASNDNAGLYLSPPNVSLDNGIYNGDQNVTLSHPDPAVTIRYTMDGSIPKSSSPSYNNSITLDENVSLRAVAFKSDYYPSVPATRSYLFDLNHDLPVLHIVTDPDNLFDDEIGIYTVGTNGTTLGFCADEVVANFNQDGWERPVNLTFFEPDGSEGFNVNAGIQVGGSCSRDQALKGLNIYLRSNRYGDKDIDYKIFPGKKHKKYKRLKLRNSGQDLKSMVFRDGANQTILGKIEDLEFQAYRPTVVYINGEYWGMQNLRELYGGEYFEYEKDVKEEDLQLIKNPTLQHVVKEGNDVHYRELYEYFLSNDISESTNYDYVSGQIDIDNFINYWASMIYIGADDWPANNMLVWRENKAGAKWRWPVVDTDASTNIYDFESGTGPASDKLSKLLDPNLEGWPNSSRSTVLFRGLMDNEAFRDEYIQRTCSFIHLVFDEDRVTQIIDSLKQNIDSEIADHIDRWKFDTPYLDDYGDWIDNIGKFKTFFEMRADFMRSHLNNNLDLDGTYDLSINFDENSGGNVYVNANEMLLPYDYEGIYFKNIPLRLKAEPKEGYIFSHWQETGETNPVIYYVDNSDAILTPIFIAACLPSNFEDADEDGICDAIDNCPNDPNPNQEDSDDDGIGDVCDDCDESLEGTACNDGDDCTINDVFDNECNCAGVFEDADEDGVCDAIDNCPNDANPNQEDSDEDGVGDVCDDCVTSIAGTACDDGDDCTINDVLDNACNCLGVFEDEDMDGVCSATDCDDMDASIPAAVGSSCNDNNPATINDQIQADQCTCQGDLPTNNYCEAQGDFPWHDWIGQVVFEDINNSSSRKKYTDFSNLVANVNAGSTYPIDLSAHFNYAGHAAYWRVWIDYNQDNIFQEPAEIAFSGMTNAPPDETPVVTINGMISIPSTATNGQTRMRIAKKRSGYADPCESFPFGEVEDYRVNINASSGPTLDLVCPNNIEMTAELGENSMPVSWPDPTVVSTCTTGNTTLTQIAGPSSGSSIPIGLTTISYEASDDCGNSTTCDFIILISEENSQPGEYCISEGELPWNQRITNVSFGSINNDSGKEGYGDFTDQSTVVEKGAIVPCSILPKFSWTQWDEYIRVWIDYNQDGDFMDAGELVLESIYQAAANGSNSTAVQGMITIPMSAASGTTRMRVSMKQAAYADPCEIFELGEVEDYSIIITEPTSAPRNANEQTTAFQAKAKNISIFPNPARDQLFLTMKDYAGQAAVVKIYNQLGIEMDQLSVEKVVESLIRFDLSAYSAGVYFLAVRVGEEHLGYFKFIVY